jgi:Zn-dependent peptidase ImmA (M78 family)
MNKDMSIFLLICWIVFCLVNLIEGIYDDIKENKIILNCTFSKLIQEVLYFCAPVYKQHNIKYYPLYMVSKSTSKPNRLGCYILQKKKIVIYINNYEGSESERIKDIIHCILHEIEHHISHLTNPDFKNYEVYSKNVGYSSNIFEISANRFADEKLNECIEQLRQKGILT